MIDRERMLGWWVAHAAHCADETAWCLRRYYDKTWYCEAKPVEEWLDTAQDYAKGWREATLMVERLRHEQAQIARREGASNDTACV